jgi:nicotinamidase-related amidase
MVIDVTEEFVGPPLPTLEAVQHIRTAVGLPAWRAVEVIRRLVDAFHQANRPVIYTRSYPGERFGGAAVGASNPTVTSQIVDALAPGEADLVLEKPRASAFFETPLTSHLLRTAIRAVVIVGGTTSGCVRATALDASSFGFGVVIAHDGCFDRSQLSHLVALQELDVKYATVMDSNAVLGQFERSQSMLSPVAST